jgi:hypothetical protein
MHGAMNITSWHNANFDQFHIKVAYIVTLSCFIYKMKFKRCLDINFDDMLDTVGTSPIIIQNKTLDLKTLTVNHKIQTWKPWLKPHPLNLKIQTWKF